MFLRGPWLCVPYDGHDMAVVEIGIAYPGHEPEWTPAFLDWENGERVAKVRIRYLPPGRLDVSLRANGQVLLSRSFLGSKVSA